MAKEEGRISTNCLFCILFFKRGLELMQESGEHMELGIFDFYKVFSRAFVKGVMGQLGFEWKPGDVVNDPGRRFALSWAFKGCMSL